MTEKHTEWWLKHHNQQQWYTKVKENTKVEWNSQGLRIHISLSCCVKGSEARAGCRVNQQVCFCHTVWTVFALQRPQYEVIQSAWKRITHTISGFFPCSHFQSFSSVRRLFLFALCWVVSYRQTLSPLSLSIFLPLLSFCLSFSLWRCKPLWYQLHYGRRHVSGYSILGNYKYIFKKTDWQVLFFFSEHGALYLGHILFLKQRRDIELLQAPFDSKLKKKSITWKWLNPVPPILEDCYGIIFEIFQREKLTYFPKIQTDKFDQMWNKWLEFKTTM